jgi:hypothetical protein
MNFSIWTGLIGIDTYKDWETMKIDQNRGVRPFLDPDLMKSRDPPPFLVQNLKIDENW